MNCPFCNLKNLQKRILYEDDLVLLFLAKDAVHLGQGLVVPRRHVETVGSLAPIELARMSMIVQAYGKYLLDREGFDGYNVIINNGKAAGQSVKHLHAHVLPRRQNDIDRPEMWLSAELFSKLRQPMPVEMANFITRYNSKKEPAIECLLRSDVVIKGEVVLGSNASIEHNVTLGGGEDNGIIRIGDNSVIRSGTVIYSNVSIGDNFDCGHNVVIRERSKIGNNAYILSNTQIHQAVTIGNNCRIFGFLCNRARVGNSTTMFGNLVHKYIRHGAGRVERSPVIGDNVTVGIGANVIGGVRIASECVIGAGVTVTKSTSSGKRITVNQ